ncbi:hypothetical protein L798_02988 [Zootermopsis nevadensis]|uniref:Uncharacterized protein n=1 Tax=Zootermopsis nevadensis TaxID=136037 RepID=A0A067QJ31_ZOONE|nr:hypothetical protein L798_02988 [Zootermopsis nevadensis]
MDPFEVTSICLVREMKEIFKTLTGSIRALNEKCIKLEKQIGIFRADRTELQNQLNYEGFLVQQHEFSLHDMIEEQNKLQEHMSHLFQQVTELHAESMYAFILFKYKVKGCRL